jgi:hypothetical protein
MLLAFDVFKIEIIGGAGIPYRMQVGLENGEV